MLITRLGLICPEPEILIYPCSLGKKRSGARLNLFIARVRNFPEQQTIE